MAWLAANQEVSNVWDSEDRTDYGAEDVALADMEPPLTEEEEEALF